MAEKSRESKKRILEEKIRVLKQDGDPDVEDLALGVTKGGSGLLQSSAQDMESLEQLLLHSTGVAGILENLAKCVGMI